MLRRPLLTGTVAGIIMGDTVQGLAIGATLELMWMGIGNVGAYSATLLPGQSSASLWAYPQRRHRCGYHPRRPGVDTLPAASHHLALFR
jgi:hypothetical protein